MEWNGMEQKRLKNVSMYECVCVCVVCDFSHMYIHQVSFSLPAFMCQDMANLRDSQLDFSHFKNPQNPTVFQYQLMLPGGNPISSPCFTCAILIQSASTEPAQSQSIIKTSSQKVLYISGPLNKSTPSAYQTGCRENSSDHMNISIRIGSGQRERIVYDLHQFPKYF